jgi:hypothetical protein
VNKMAIGGGTTTNLDALVKYLKYSEAFKQL